MTDSDKVVCPWCAKPVEGKRGPLPRRLGDYVHTCGATFGITDDGVALVRPGHPDYLATDPDSIGAWLDRARAHALETGEGTEEMAPGVMRAEAEAAAAHAIMVQKGYSTPEIEAERLSKDRAKGRR